MATVHHRPISERQEKPRTTASTRRQRFHAVERIICAGDEADNLIVEGGRSLRVFRLGVLR